MGKYVKLKLDVVFKSMFGDEKNEDALTNLISRLLEIPRESIRQIVLENVELTPETFEEKFSRVDLKMTVDDRVVNVEIQVRNQDCFVERSLYYWSKIYTSKLKSGEGYDNLKETVCINIVDFSLFDCEEYHSQFKIMETKRHEVLTDKLNIHFFELSKIDDNVDEGNLMKLWLQLIKAETEEEISMLENTNVKEINDAIVILRNLSADEKTRYMADMREKTLHDAANELNTAVRKGRAEERAEMLEKMRKSGMSEEQIQKILEL